MALLDGMTRKCPPGTDKSMTVPKGSVNDSPVRTGPAPSPKSLGPRTA
jgi:hypothetical protein